MHALVSLHDIVLAARGIFLELLKVGEALGKLENLSGHAARDHGGRGRDSRNDFACDHLGRMCRALFDLIVPSAET